MKTMRKVLSVTLLTAVLLTSISAYSQCKVILTNGRVTKCAAIKVDSKGNLTLKLSGGGGSQIIKRGRYKSAIIPKPAKKINYLKQLYSQQQYNKAIAFADKMLSAYKFLGWGGLAAYVKGNSLLKQKKASQALLTFKQNKRYGGNYVMDLQQGIVEALFAMGKKDQAEKELAALAKSNKASVAAFSFNARGQILADKGNKRDAVLEYLKTLLLISPNDRSAAVHRKEARTQVVKLLESMGDTRAASFKNMR
ncbi:MAG: tetratricopeptide repeat protein [Verrucomicrobiota bacterium]|nr:tetratricopeptide repeat protein [Verrucomicrobiota bacterium]